MRFDDSLETVLSAEMASPFGAQSTWRQLVDLIGRGRIAASGTAIARLRTIRADVPPPVRGASARALAAARPPAALVALFAEDEIAVAAPVLRSAALTVREWNALLPALSPAARSILRHRRDLAPEVDRALESFGSVDFVLGSPDVVSVAQPDIPPTAEAPAAEPIELAASPSPETIAPVSPFLSIAAIAAGLPVVAAAIRHAGAIADEAADTPEDDPVDDPVPSKPAGGTFEIAELVARIDAYQRRREETPAERPELESQPELFARGPHPAERFRFETDAGGVVRWIEGTARAPLIGLSLDLAAVPGESCVDGVAAGAFRRRAGFADARLVVDGQSDAAGQWRITGIPAFDRATGRFTGYRGTARRPRADETAGPMREARDPPARRANDPVADALRQLVHELRTPTNAIAGFAEMIEAQILGPVPAAYRAHAAAIRSQSGELLTAIDDMDMAARIETQALDLRTGDVPVAPMFRRIAADLTALANLRGATLDMDAGDALAILGDDRTVERLISRLMATLVASGGAGERIGVAAMREDGKVAIVFDRPAALAAYGEDRLLTIDAEAEAARDGAPLLGTGFALRLARNLAAELHGSLEIGDRTLTLRLPAAFTAEMEQAFLS